MKTQYHQILGVDENATLREIKKAYRKQAQLLHPDVNSSPDAHEQFVLLNEAYDYFQKVKSGKQPNRRRTTGRTQTNYQSSRNWQAEERRRARERARKHAQMKYEEFVQTDYYKTSEAMHTVLDFSIFMMVLLLLTFVPAISIYYNGMYGLVGSGVMLLITFPYWINVLYNRPELNWKKLGDSIVHIVKTKTFRVILVALINLYILLNVGLNTLITLSSLSIFFIGSIVAGFIMTLFTNNPYFKKLSLLGIGPGILNLFLLLNFLFSSGETIERYRIYHHVYKVKYSLGFGYEQTAQITLQDNKYEEYIGIRIFADFEEMENAAHITYYFEEGLLGLRVLKNYEFR